MQTLKLLSYNAQVGIAMQGLRHYVLNSWQHVMPHVGRMQTLVQVANLLKTYDVVALQEVDTGSFRSHYINHIRYFAEEARFPYAAQQVTRNLGKWAQVAKGLLSRYPLCQVERLALPKGLNGRGILLAWLGTGETKLLLVNVHLSLGPKAQRRQLDFLADIISGVRFAVVMGDFNMAPSALTHHPMIKTGQLCYDDQLQETHPSWGPTRCLDYILFTPALTCLKMETLRWDYSDHLPVSMCLQVPEEVQLSRGTENEQENIVGRAKAQQ